jgi:hypothetical protein
MEKRRNPVLSINDLYCYFLYSCKNMIACQPSCSCSMFHYATSKKRSHPYSFFFLTIYCWSFGPSRVEHSWLYCWSFTPELFWRSYYVSCLRYSWLDLSRTFVDLNTRSFWTTHLRKKAHWFFCIGPAGNDDVWQYLGGM